MIRDFDQLKRRVASMQKVLPAVDHAEKACKHRFKRKDALEKNALLDALYHIRVNGVTNGDFSFAGVVPESTEEIVTVESIELRLSELGWVDDIADDRL